MELPSIGILANRTSNCLTEMDYFRNLITEGKRIGGNVFLFSPQDILMERKRITGYVPSLKGGWRKRIAPWPDIVIDRNRSRADKAFFSVRNRKLFAFANSTYTYKKKATELFAETESLNGWIPKTVEYSPKQLGGMLKEFSMLYIKPANGTGGLSVVKLVYKKGRYTVLGRERISSLIKVSFSTRRALIRWLNSWVRTQNIRSGKFMIQQGLDLELTPNRIIDARLLIQKDWEGQWRVTGMALRMGGRNSPTTNILHKGGKALQFKPFMVNRFGLEKAEAIQQQCEWLSFEVVRTIERKYGAMLEFGLDIGIDINGKVWLIEANPKPSRNVFLKTGEVDVYNTAVQRTIEYAMFLARESRIKLSGNNGKTAKASLE